VASNGIMFIPYFVDISQKVQKLKERINHCIYLVSML